MRIIAAYMLAVLGGNQNPDKNAVKKVLDSVGAKYDEKRIDTLIGELGGKDLGALIAAGNLKIGSLGPIGGGGAAPAAGGDSKAADKKADAKGADKKGGDKKGADKPKKEEPKDEEEDPDMGLSLFD